ncbi:hypothetical protein [Kitasatospora sp. NPDC088779]|uniref:hypothetical protein n=1 Tax=Kitasatospora sp. NPDC088779 TaxID=3154964 RepID=UPI003444574B
MSIFADLAAAAAELRERPHDEQLAYLGQLLTDERLDRWAGQAAVVPGQGSVRDELHSLRTLIEVRRGDLSQLLGILPQEAIERLLDPEIVHSWTKLDAAATTCEKGLGGARSTITAYRGFVHADAQDAERLLGTLIGRIERFPVEVRRNRAAAARGLRAAHAALERRLRTAACALPARSTERLLARATAA